MADSSFDLRSLSIELTVEYVVARPHGTREQPPLLLVLHGWGQTCQSILRRFRALRERGILLVAPQAPHPLYVKMEPKKVGFSWLTQYERDRAVVEFRRYMKRLLEQLRTDEQFDASRVYIAGYSQGVSMAYRLAVSDVVTPAGLIACNGDLPPDVVPNLPEVRKFPVLLVHGESDPLVPVAKCEEALQTLSQHGFDVDRWTHSGAHEIPREAAAHIGDWILSHLPS